MYDDLRNGLMHRENDAVYTVTTCTLLGWQIANEYQPDDHQIAGNQLWHVVSERGRYA